MTWCLAKTSTTLAVPLTIETFISSKCTSSCSPSSSTSKCRILARSLVATNDFATAESMNTLIIFKLSPSASAASVSHNHTLFLHMSHSSQVSAKGELKKRTSLAAHGEENKHKIGECVRRHASEKPNRATAALPQACSGNLETNPERAREEPRRAPNATGPGRQREWPIWDVDFGNALSATRQYTRGNARDERARRLWKTLLAEWRVSRT